MTARKKRPSAPQSTPNHKTHVAETCLVLDPQQIAGLASEFWAARGFVEGGAEEDWRCAEEELKRRLTVGR
ncbi:MAG TPA: DUF2934 domain-containing protein [Bryobacteraceae bacterium]|jgi:hypothetical protein